MQIFYIECTSDYTVVHAGSVPGATIVPVVNVIGWLDDKTRQPVVNASGVPVAPSGLALLEPIGVTADVYNTLMAGMTTNSYTYNPTTQTVSVKAAIDAPATS